MNPPKSNCCETPCHTDKPLPENEIDVRWLKLAIGLVAFTGLYTMAEGVIALYSGMGAKSITLESFGLDSLIEVAASALILWRLLLQSRGESDAIVEVSEGQVHRFVGITFLMLSAFILWSSSQILFLQEHPHFSAFGLAITSLSVLLMPVLAWAKLRVADKIHSQALKMEAKETLACGILSLIALAGLAANALWAWWWADPLASLLMLPWLIREGLAGIRGESCCG
jgi:hypothetical protein